VRGYAIVFEYVATRPMTASAERFWKTREQIIRGAGYDVRSRTVDVRPALRGKAAALDAAAQAAQTAVNETAVELPPGAEVEFGTLSHLAPLLSLPAPAPEIVAPPAPGRAIVTLPQLASMSR
jgi:hypothetical protein